MKVLPTKFTVSPSEAVNINLCERSEQDRLVKTQLTRQCRAAKADERHRDLAQLNSMLDKLEQVRDKLTEMGL